MRKLHSSLLVLLFALFPTQLTFYLWFADALVLGRRIDYLASVISLTDIVILAFVLLTHIVYRLKIGRLFLLCLVIPWALLIIWYGFTPPSFAIFQTIKYTELLLLGYACIKSRPTRQQLLLGLGIGMSYSVFLALLQFFNQGSVGGLWYWLGERRFSMQTPAIAQTIVYGQTLLRPYATFPHPNVLGGFLVGLTPLFLFSHPKNTAQYVRRRSGLALLSIGIFLSFSRIAWVVFAAEWWWYFVRRQHPSRWLAVLIGVGILILEESTFGRFEMLLGNQTTIEERKQLVAAAWQLWQQKPWFGVGIRNFIPSLVAVMSPPYLLQPVHSAYLLILTELGAVGLFGALVSLGYALRAGVRKKQEWLVVALVCLLVLGLFDHYLVTLPQTQLLLVLLFSLLVM